MCTEQPRFVNLAVGAHAQGQLTVQQPGFVNVVAGFRRAPTTKNSTCYRGTSRSDAAEGDGSVVADPPPPDSAARDAREGELVGVEGCEQSSCEDVVADSLDQPALEDEGCLVTRGQRRSEVRRAHNHAPRAQGEASGGKAKFHVASNINSA